MRWLQWASIDLEGGFGGVEVHARSVARELRVLGVECAFSNDEKDLDSDKWDVIHTHGSSFVRRGKSKATHIHTLHGTTLGRMAAMNEWTWIGGYLAALREWRGVRSADIVMSVHPNVWLLREAKRLGKVAEVCWNGWDSATSLGSLPEGLARSLDEIGKFWVFVGRGGDRVKGSARLRAAMPLLHDVRWVAAPGDGFEGLERVVKTGRLSSAEVSALMRKASGIVIPSHYEGLPLALLEALSEGLPAVAPRVGGVVALSEELRGLFVVDSSDPRAIADAVRRAQAESDAEREQRRATNRSVLPSWATVAKTYLDAAKRKAHV